MTSPPLFRSVRRFGLSRVVVVATCLLGLGLHAESLPETVATEAFEGSVRVDGAQRTAKWSAWFDVPPADMRTRLTTWEKVGAIVEDVIEFSVLNDGRNGAPARLSITRKSPAFFIPNPRFVVDVFVADAPDGATVVTWKLVEGTPKRALRRWTLTAEGEGTRVDHESVVLLPFKPPEFLLGEPREVLAREIDLFRTHVGAKKALRQPLP